MASRWSQVSVTRAGTYVDRDPLRSGGRKRTKESTAALRHHFLNSDTDREGRLTALRASDALPSPITFISTLPSRPMDLWRVNGSPIESQGTALKLLAIAIGSESTCTDCNRVPRLRFPPRTPSFCHVQFHCKSTPESTPIPTTIRRGFGLTLPRKRRWGTPPTLPSRRADLPGFLLLRTAEKSKSPWATLLLFGGIRMDDVVTMLEVRHRFEISAALCSSPGREIALAAHR
jgi:hypothetical protein